MNYYRRYVGDFQRDTGHLSLTEVGAYDRLLDHLYATETPLPAEMSVLCRICRAVTADEQEAVESVVAQFFPLNGDGKRHNKRATKEIGVSQTARDNGKNGGRPITQHKTEQITGTRTGSKTGQETGSVTGEGGGLVHPPTTNHHPPTTTPQPLSTAHQPRSKTKAARPMKPVAVLPAWLPAEPWGQYVEMRRQKRKPMTDKAVELIFKKLGGFRVDGENLTAVLLQSVENGWTGVFPVKPAGNGGAGSDVRTANELAAQTWLESPATPAAPKSHDFPDDFIADFLNDWGHKLGVTQGADESETEFYAAVVAAIEVESNTGNAEASEWLEQYGEQARSMVPA